MRRPSTGVFSRFRSNGLNANRFISRISGFSPYRQPNRTRGSDRTITTCSLRKQMEDGSGMSSFSLNLANGLLTTSTEEEMIEDDLYRYTRHRWLCNEAENLAIRHRKFNISALIEVAIKAAGDGARSCVKALKCVEGQYNKALIMTMDNGHEIFAKLPNPNAGPPFYTLASEVATRHFLRTALDLPIPRVYAYSLDSDNPVGAEYMLEEKAQGEPLGNLWYDWPMKSQRDLIDQLIDFESRLKSIWFRKHGCLYFKKDMVNKKVPFREPEPVRETLGDATGGINAALLDEFVIGPVTEAVLWEGEKQSMELDHGPWSSPESYLAALTINEMRWTQLHTKPRLNVYRSPDLPECPDDYISLLKKFLQLIRLISPGPSQTSFSHPDLHLNNIFVDPETKKITCVIDWQSASISEPFLQQHIPRLILPVDNEERSNPTLGSRDTTELSNDTTKLLEYYQNLSRRKNSRWWAAADVPNRTLLVDTLQCMLGAWNRRDLFSFRHALIGITACWQEIKQTPTSCPIAFTPSELELHSDEMELLEGLSQVLHELHNNNLISLGGMVLRKDFEQASAINQRVKEMFIGLVKSEEQKELCSRIWRYQDTER